MARTVSKITISEDVATPVEFVRLIPGPNRIDIDYNSGVTGTITPFQTSNIEKTAFYKNVYLDGETAVFTESGDFVIDGPAFIGFKSESMDGGTVEISVQNAS